MKELLFTNWHFLQWVLLVLALFLLGQAYILKEWMFIGFGLFLFIQMFFNLGCCSSVCSIPNNKYSKDE